MRLVLYNIRYGTGGKMNRFPLSGYLGRTTRHLDTLARFLNDLHPDIIGLVEVDAGSYRSRRCNQAEELAEELGHFHVYRSKYSERSPFARWVPVLNKQGNALLARDTIRAQRFHYLNAGMKRLVIELELDHVVIFLVHLALSFRVRHGQLSDLQKLIRDCKKPLLVAGDFNALWGEAEIDLFLAATGLRNANPRNEPSFPSWAPKRHLDFILHSPGIQVGRFEVPKVPYSDHLPLVCDFEVPDPSWSGHQRA